MCGIAGSWRPQGHADATALQALGQAMAGAIAQRGPDGEGVAVDAFHGLVLAHRRLAILDRSAAGQQPMRSACGRWTLVYNGELYNHAELRRQLLALGHPFRGRSDTEVLLAGIAQWGLQPTLQRGNGMFALAAWDSHDRRLWLARDRFGKKPLYYTRSSDGALVFGSSLAALRVHPAIALRVDPDALAQLLRFGYVPAPQAILRGVHKLSGGQLLCIDAATLREGRALVPRAWWSARDAQSAAIRAGFAGDEGDAEAQLAAVLADAVALRGEADVPLGVFLSGGVDSSLVTALLQAQSARPVQSFAIGFDGAGDDESRHAEAVARHLGTHHHTFRLDGRRALELVPGLAHIADEPLADPSLIPTALLCREVRQSVTVALSGDGGDELFFGYERYARALRNRRWLATVPAPLRRAFAGRPGEAARLGGLAALRAAFAAEGIQATLAERVCRWREPERVVIGARRIPSVYDDPACLPDAGGDAEAMLAMDVAGGLADGILAKVDRASMAVGLEVRSPILDWRVAELAWSLPLAFHWRDGQRKRLLRRLLHRHVPPALVERPKQGFGAPVGPWLRGPLRDWAEALLAPTRLRDEGHFDPAPLRRIWDAFLAGQRKWHTHLWSVLVFQAWYEHARQPPTLPALGQSREDIDPRREDAHEDALATADPG